MFTEILKNGKRVEFGMDSNDNYFGYIYDSLGSVESATITKTMAEIHEWIQEREN